MGVRERDFIPLEETCGMKRDVFDAIRFCIWRLS